MLASPNPCTIDAAPCIRSPPFKTISSNNPARHQLMGLNQSVIKQDLDILRPGHSFAVKLPETEDEIRMALTGGGYNLHWQITFDDDVRWILRVRRDLSRRTTPVPGLTWTEYCWEDVEREATALQVMHVSGIRTVSNAYMPVLKQAVVPAYPSAHFYCDFMRGARWPPSDAPLDCGLIDDGGAKKYLEGYADHQIALSNIPFDRIGQLSRTRDGDVSLVSMYNVGYNVHHKSGPFVTYLEYILDLWYQSIGGHRGEIRSLNGYLAYLDKKRILEGCKDFGGPAGVFYIKHADDGVGQNFAQDGKLSAVLDWQGVSTTSKADAFMSASWLFAPDTTRANGSYAGHLDRLSRDEELLCTIYQEKGRPDLADCIRDTPKMRILLEPIHWWRSDVESIRRFRTVFGQGQTDIAMPSTVQEWTAECLERFKDDPKIAEIQSMPKAEPWQPPMPPGLAEKLAQAHLDL